MNYPAWCREAWVAFQAFRNLGISADEIYLMCAPMKSARGAPAVPVLGVAVVQGGKRFVWTLALDPGEAPAEVWARYCAHMIEAPQAEHDAAWEGSGIVQRGGPNYIELVQRMTARGFVVPHPLGELLRPPGAARPN